MDISIEQIDLWRSTPKEHQRLEFKEAKHQYDSRKLYEYCIAIANEGGGHLLLGIADALPRPVVGTSAFPDILKITQELFNRLGFRVDVEQVHHPAGGHCFPRPFTPERNGL